MLYATCKSSIYVLIQCFGVAQFNKIIILKIYVYDLLLVNSCIEQFLLKQLHKGTLATAPHTSYNLYYLLVTQ